MNSLYCFPVSLIIIVLLISGCAVGPDFVRPDAPSQEEWIDSDVPQIKTEPADLTDWWKVFNDPVLDSLIETAYGQNLPLQIAGLRIMEARAQLGVAVGSQFPQLQQLSGSATAVEISDNAPNALAADKFYYDYQLGFDAAWELDFWGRFRRGVESAEANYLASIAGYDNALVTLTAEVARSYVLIRTFEDRIRIADENVKIQKRSLEIAEARFEGGLVTELDVQQARALLNDTRASISRLEIGLRQAQHGLSILLGIPPGELKNVLVKSGTIPEAPSEVVVGIPADLLRRRPDIRTAELQTAAQSARIGVAKADLYPQFSLVGSIGLQSSEQGGIPSNTANFSDLFDSESITYFVGPSLQWPILNYGRIKNRVRVQDVRFQQLVVNYQNTVLNAYREVEDAMVGFLRSQEQVKYLADSVNASKRSVDLSLIQYREGVADYQR
ncbi:MAG: efflux transporter outer membrane subunit, partial [Thermodesulfovibrionia bacterium]|nr:efflux transporter outer membrane subunit [Thermodesulfovibrionia bacterium]